MANLLGLDRSEESHKLPYGGQQPASVSRVGRRLSSTGISATAPQVMANCLSTSLVEQVTWTLLLGEFVQTHLSLAQIGRNCRGPAVGGGRIDYPAPRAIRHLPTDPEQTQY